MDVRESEMSRDMQGLSTLIKHYFQYNVNKKHLGFSNYFLSNLNLHTDDNNEIFIDDPGHQNNERKEIYISFLKI